MRKYRINLFGSLEITNPKGERVSILGSKQQALLAYLALNLTVPPTRDRVMTLLWGERFIEQARQSLRQSISNLRKQFMFEGRCAIQADNDRIGIDEEMAEVDLTEFTRLASKNNLQADGQAVALFKNTLLDGLFVRESDFEEWLTAERVRVNDIAYPVFERLIAGFLKSGDQGLALDTSRQLIALDKMREPSHRLQMRILAQSGQRAAAIKQYNTCAEILSRELDVEPDPDTKQLLEEIKSPAATANEPKLPPLETAPILSSDIPEQIQQPASQKISIAVLPFSFIGTGTDLSALAFGLTDDITAALSKFRWLDIMAQMPLGEHDNPTATMRRNVLENDGAYTIEGSVRQLGDQLRITAQLLEINSGKFVTVNRHDLSYNELLNNPDPIIEKIVASLESELVAFEGVKARTLSDGNMSAWDCYHLGLATQYEFTTEGNARAQALFRRAIEMDASFALAYARLSYAAVLSAIYFEADQNSGLLDEALSLAQKAARLDDQDGVIFFALGRVHLARGEYEQSITHLKQAIELNSSLAQAYCGLGDSLAYLGRADDAIPHFEEAVRLSPHDPHRWAFSMYGSLAFIFDGEYEKAAEWARNSIQVPNSHYWANAALVSALGHLGNALEISPAVKNLLALKPDFTCSFARERMFYLKDKIQIERYVEGLSKAGLPK